MCTSMSPDPRMVREPMPGPVIVALNHDRRLAPSTSWVAFSPRAKGGRASGGRVSGSVAPPALVRGPAPRSAQLPLPGQPGRIGAGQAVGLGDVHGQQV